MARTFDGANDLLVTSAGATTGTTFGTFAVIMRRNSTAYNSLVFLHTSTPTGIYGLLIEDNASGNQLELATASASRFSTFTVVNADGWVLVAGGKATGTTTPRFHKYVYSTNAWTHENGGGTLANASGTVNNVRFGEWEGVDDFGGDIAAVAMWKRNLSDAEVETLPHSVMAWHATAPTAFWLFDQSLTTQAVIDLTGGGANQSSLTGTTVSTNSTPLSYGMVRAPATVAAASVDATAFPDPVALTIAVPAPTLSAGSTPTPATVTATTAVPTATLSAGSSTTPATVAATMAVPTPAAGVGTTVTPATVAATFAVPTPTTSADSSVTPATVAAVVAVPTPVISAGASTTPATVALTTAVPTPNVTAGSTASPAAVAATLAVPAPVLAASSTASPAVVAATLAAPTPTVAAGSTATPAVVPLVIDIPTPAIQAGGNATVQPATVALTIAVPTPSVSAAASVTPATVAAVVSVPAPTLTASGTAEPAVVPLVFTIPTPAASEFIPATYGAHPVLATASVGPPNTTGTEDERWLTTSATRYPSATRSTTPTVSSQTPPSP